MERWRGRVALITGASSGIGLAVAEDLVSRGMTVIGCARNVRQIEVVASRKREGESEKGERTTPLIAIRCDVTKEQDIADMFAEILQKYGGIDCLINSAGLAFPEPLLSGETQNWKTMLETNILGTSICTREAISQMKFLGKEEGLIININSTAGHRVSNNRDFHFYQATKHAVTSLTKGFSQELRENKSNIKVTAISPGLVHSEFISRMYSNVTDSINTGNYQQTMERMHASRCLQTSDVVSAVVYTMSCPAHVLVEMILTHTER